MAESKTTSSLFMSSLRFMEKPWNSRLIRCSPAIGWNEIITPRHSRLVIALAGIENDIKLDAKLGSELTHVIIMSRTRAGVRSETVP
jgi:hypothetical protein